MNIFNYPLNELFKKNKKVLFYMILIFSFYIFLVKFIRPFSYQNHPDLNSFNFILGILPNFLGAILSYLMYNGFLEFSKIKSGSYTIVLVLFIEIERYYNEGAAFDVYDIIASVIGIGILFFFYSSNSKELIKKQLDNKKRNV